MVGTGTNCYVPTFANSGYALRLVTQFEGVQVRPESFGTQQIRQPNHRRGKEADLDEDIDECAERVFDNCEQRLDVRAETS